MTARIIGTGVYVPEQIVTNKDLMKFLDTDDAWIQERTGIRERRISTKESTVDMEATEETVPTSSLNLFLLEDTPL